MVLSLTIFSCSKVAKGEYIISGEAKGIPNGKMVVVKQKNNFGLLVNLDSAKIKDGKFEIKGKVKDLGMFALFIKDIPQPIPFILESGEIDVRVDKDSIWKSEIGGTYNNDEFQKFNLKITSIQKRLQAYQNKNMQKFMEAQKKNDSAVMESLKKGYGDIQKEMEDYMAKYPDQNPEAYISLLLLQSQFNSPKFNLAAVKKTFNKLESSLKTSKIGKEIADKLKVIENNNKVKPDMSLIGKMAPDFSAKTPQGAVVSLKQSLGKVTIVDFWASWCGPCRKENPNVVALYNEFHEKGLNIIGVSLDKDLNKWNEAIAKDKITWTQVSNLKEWQDPIAKLYGVEQIPTTFILDASGVVIAKDLSGEELRAKLILLLGSK